MGSVLKKRMRETRIRASLIKFRTRTEALELTYSNYIINKGVPDSVFQ